MQPERLAGALQIAGFVFLSIAGFAVGFALGCLVVGLSLLAVGIAVERGS